MKKAFRMIAVMITFSLLAAGTGIDVYAAAPGEKKDDEKGSFQAGDKLSGFTVNEVYDFSVWCAKVYVFEHDRTGAKAVFIQNDDPNRFFMLEFDTPAQDNKGAAHVLEHSIMSGSAKYPSRSLSMALRNRAYITYMNAFTKNASTSFPVASLSEEQLLVMADYYTDLCFDPTILRDEDIFRSEAWRFVPDETGKKVGVTGTIYSEMRGRYSADMEALRASVGILYPGCPSSYIAGGIPQDILSLSYEKVKEFHERYYHPSNCTAYLYGDIKNVKAFLDGLDGCFARYEKREYTKTGKEGSHAAGYAEIRRDIPAASADGAENSTDMVYAFDLGKLSDEALEEVYAFARCCDNSYSTAMLRLRSIFPEADFGVSVIPDSENVIFTVAAHGMYEDDAPMLRAAVLDILKGLSQDGLRDNELEYFKNRMQTDSALSRDGRNSTIDMLISAVNYSSNGRDTLYYMKLRDRMADMSWFDNDIVKKTAALLATAPRSSMAAVTPRPELLTKKDAALSDALEKYSASMSDEDMKKLSEDAERIAAKASDDPSEYLEKLSVVKVSDLPDDIGEYDTCDETDKDGVRRVGVYTSTEGAAYTKVYIDASAIPQDMLGYLALYTDLVNGRFVPTKSHKQGELADLINEYSFRGQEISLTVTSAGDGYTPYVAASFLSSPATSEDAFSLLYERMYESVFDDPAAILDGIASIRNVVGGNIAASPEQTARYLAYSAHGEGAAYYECTHYSGYYEFLGSLLESGASDADGICEKLGSVRDMLCRKKGTVIGYAVTKEEEGDHLKAAEAFTGRLSDTDAKKQTYSFAKYEYPLAVLTGSGVAANVAATADITRYGIKEDSAATDLALAMMTEYYLTRMTRDRYGAYTCSYMYDFPAVSVFTARDPVIKETYETYDKMGEAWRIIRGQVTQKDLDGYITMLYSRAAVSDGDISDAAALISDIVAKRGADRLAKYAKELKSVSISDLSKYDDLFAGFAGGADRVTAGSADLIEKNRDEFSGIIDLFAK